MVRIVRTRANAPAVVEKLQADFARALKLPEVRQMLEGQGAEAVGNSPAEFAQTVRSDLERWRTVIRNAGITPD